MQRGRIIAEGSYAEVSSQSPGHRGLHGYRRRSTQDDTGNTEALRVRDLHAYYGESHILHGVDFSVNRGEVVTLLGRNGAGRTTTLKALLGLVGRRTGSVQIDGREAIDLPPHRVARLGVGYCPEERGIYASLSAEENLLLPPVIGPAGMSIEEIYGMFPNLKERRAGAGYAPVRRGAADAGGGAHSAGGRPGAVAGRDFGGACAGDRAGSVARPYKRCAARDTPSSWWSRTSTLPRRWPTGSTSWNMAGW